MSVPQLAKLNKFFGQYLQTFVVSISMSSDHSDGRTIRFFFHLNNQTLLYRWFYWNMRWTGSFQGTQVNLSVLLEKPDTRIHSGTLNMESLKPSCRICPRTKDHAEKALCQWGLPDFPSITVDKVSLWPGWKTYSFIGRGGINWDRGGNLIKFINRRSHRGTLHRGTWTVCINEVYFLTFKLYCCTSPQ